MPDNIAISLKNVSKLYKLHGSQSDQLIDVLGLKRFGFKTKTETKEFAALSEISLEVSRGHRVGIIGRNGSGKTTLLKLICGNFEPTYGQVSVNGNIQALMNVGIGFHPEYTGRENVDASLQYNGLKKDEYQDAIKDIIEFCELGVFIDQPFKTYSLGMQARLMFATATAIRPDILIVDEVLGAGDAYFVAKSKARVDSFVKSGCTMLLVSHSMQQVLELCDEVIWLDQGQIRMRGEALLVVKAYEEYLYGPIESLKLPKISSTGIDNFDNDEDKFNLNVDLNAQDCNPLKAIKHHQAPEFIPHANILEFTKVPFSGEFKFIAQGGMSRWSGEKGLKFIGFTIINEQGESNNLVSLRPVNFRMEIVCEQSGDYLCRYGIVIFDYSGNVISRIISPADKFSIKEGNTRIVDMALNPNQLGPGEYLLSISIHKYDKLEKFNVTDRYDLINRGFKFTVDLPQSLGAISANFFHSAEWMFLEKQ